MAALHPIIPFNLIIDTDVGLIRVIDKKYHNSDVFHSSMLSAPVKPLIYNLVNRPVINPLCIVMIDKSDTNTMDLLYEQFIEDEYENIVGNSVTTDLFSALKLFMQNEAVCPTILCKNEIEANIIAKLDFNGKTVPTVIGTLEENCGFYDPIYVKDFRELPKLNLRGKNIYVADYLFNFMNKDNSRVLIEDVHLAIDSSNIIKISDVYHLDDSFIAKG